MVATGVKFTEDLRESVLAVIRDIVVAAVKAKSHMKVADIVELTSELKRVLMYAGDVSSPMPGMAESPTISNEDDVLRNAEYLRKWAAEETAKARGEICKAIQPEIVPAQPLSAPFPPTADSGDSIYDPIAATAKLPPFDDLLQSMWVAEHSARKVDSQTVVISSVHYADFLAMRDQLMAINELAKHGNVDIDIIDRRVTMTSANSLKTIRAEPTETMTSAAHRLLGLIECEMVF